MIANGDGAQVELAAQHRAFSKLTALPTLASSPTCSRSGARKVIEPIWASRPIFAPVRAASQHTVRSR